MPEAGGMLFERDGELADLDTVLGRLRGASASGGLLLVQGPAGIGKTSLLRALRAGAAERDLRVLAATGADLERDYAFGVVHQLFDAVVYGADPGERRRWFAGAPASAAGVFDATAATVPSHALLHGLFWLCATLAEQGPLVLVVDDAHWADEPSLRFLEFLARRADELPLLLAVAERPSEAGELGALLASLAHLPATRFLVPGPLSTRAARELMAARLGTEPGPAFVEACITATGGNPLLLSELGREMARRGSRGEDTDAADARSAVPGSLVRTVTARLDRIGPHALAVARAMTVLGERVRSDRVARLTALAPTEVDAALDGLVRSEILAGDGIAFVHPLVREAIAGGLARTAQRRLHRQVADILRADGERDEVVALHLLATDPAGDPGAAALLRRAGERAAVEGAPALACRLLQRALDEPPAPADRAATHFGLGHAAMVTGRTEAALEHLAIAAADSDPVIVARAELARVTLLNSFERTEEVVVGLRAAITGLGDRDPDLTVRLTEQLLENTVYLPELAAERAALLGGLDPVSAPPALLAQLAFDRSVQFAPREEVIELGRRAWTSGELLKDFHWGRGTPYWVNEAFCTVEAAEESAAFLRAADRAAARSGSELAVTYVALCRTHADWRFGDLRRAERAARDGLEVFTHTGLQVGIDFCTTVLAQVLLDRGDVEAAATLLEGMGIERTARVANGGEAVRARVLIAQGRAQEAIEAIERQWAHERAIGWRTTPREHSRATMITALAALGRRADALALAERVLGTLHDRDLPGATAAVLAARARAETPEVALATLADAAESAEASALRVVQADALTAYGAALRRAGQRSAAKVPLLRGREIAHAIGAGAIERRAFEELRVAGARPQRIALSGRDALTASELRTAELAAEGMTNREIAETLFVTRKTVELHLSRAYSKLDIRSRDGLAEALG